MGGTASLFTADRQEKVEEITTSMVARFQSEYLAEYRAQLTAVRTSAFLLPPSRPLAVAQPLVRLRRRGGQRAGAGLRGGGH